MSSTGEIEAVLFKRIAGGYIFQQPNPWLFGRSSRYIVDEAQKAALLAIIVPRRPVLRIAVVTALILLWVVVVATLVWAFGSGRDNPTAGDFAAIFGLTLVPLMAALIVALQRNLRRMRPILAGAPRTEQKITRGELRLAMSNAMSFERALFIGSAWGLTCAMQVFSLVTRNARHPLFGDPQSYVNVLAAAIATGLAAYYLGIAIRKLKAKPAAVAANS
jgi:hypothetical protein